MARETLLHFLFSKEGKPLYRSGNVTLEGSAETYLKPDGQPANLEEDPDGWRDVLVKFARNTKYGGLFRDFTVPMRFVKNAAKMLSDKMWTLGMEAVLHYGIMKLDRTSLPYNYAPWYLSEINLSKFVQSKTEVTVECLQGGLSKYLKAYENTPFEIDIESDEKHKAVLMDGMELENLAVFAINSGVSADPLANYGSHLVQMDLVQKEIDDIGGVAGVTRTKVSNFNPDILATGKWFFIASAPGTIKIKHNYILTTTFFAPPAIDPSATLIHGVRKIDKTGFGTTTSLLTGAVSGNNIPGVRTIQGEKEIEVAEGDQLFLFTGLTVIGATGDGQTTFEYSGDAPLFEVAYTYREPETIAKGLSPKRLAEKIVEKLTEAEPGKYGVVSKFLDSLEDSIIMVSGDSLRRIVSPKIRTSISDFFKSFNRWGIHLDIVGNNLHIERHASFYLNEVIMDLGDVVGAKVAVAEDLVFNTISNGYKEQEYKEINGRYEFNQGQKWTTPGTKIIRDLDLVSVYRADPFGAELMRINFGQKKTTDTESDNDTWFINVKKNFTNIQANLTFAVLFPPLNIPFVFVSGAPDTMDKIKKGTKFQVFGTASNNGLFSAASDAVLTSDPNVYTFIVDVGSALVSENDVFATIQIQEYILNRPAYSSVEGLLHPGTAFNTELSPHRSLLECGAYIRSVLDLMDADYIKFRSGDKNTDLVTVLGGKRISEREDVKIGSLSSRLFKPYYFTFRTKLPLSAYDILNTNPYGKIRFWHEGEPFTGFLYDGGIKPDVTETQEWKLLCAPENDLKKFKTY